ncbi:TIM barrel protein, partial [Pseudophaeobacter leonis]|uniref:TIM barrel protein n=1 Tax=Pseudophaeobacter leonis TaxID=1144477 RepID=UPI001F4F0771
KIIEDVGAKNLKLMFDCYHVGRTEGDVIAQLKQLLPITGHIQFASVPDRGTPDHGDVDYRAVFSMLDAMGWGIPLGAEYKPQSETDASLAWMSALR